MDDYYRRTIEKQEETIRQLRAEKEALLGPVWSRSELFLSMCAEFWEQSEDGERALAALEAAAPALKFSLEDSGRTRDDPARSLFSLALWDGLAHIERLEAAIPGICGAMGPETAMQILFEEEVAEIWIAQGASRALWLQKSYGAGLADGFWTSAIKDPEKDEFERIHAAQPAKIIAQGRGPGPNDMWTDAESGAELVRMFGHCGWGAHGMWPSCAQAPATDENETAGFVSSLEPGQSPDPAAFEFGLAELAAETKDCPQNCIRRWETLGELLMSGKFADCDGQKVLGALFDLEPAVFSKIRCSCRLRVPDLPECMPQAPLSFRGTLADALFLAGTPPQQLDAIARGADEATLLASLLSATPKGVPAEPYRAWAESRVVAMETLRAFGPGAIPGAARPKHQL